MKRLAGFRNLPTATPPVGFLPIEIAANTLTVRGTHVAFPTVGLNPPVGSTAASSAQWLNWTHRFFWDNLRKTFRSTSKIQNNEPDNWNWICDYDAQNNVWNTTAYAFPRTGRAHVYSWHGYDFGSGTQYYVENGGLVGAGLQGRLAKRLFGYPRDQWDFFAEGQAAADLGGSATILNNASKNEFGDEGGLDYHPNLYGQDQGGLVISCTWGVIGYNVITNQFTPIISRATFSGITGGLPADNTSVFYIRSLDACFVSSGYGHLFEVRSATDYSILPNTPANISHDTGKNEYIKIADDPDERGYFWGFGFNPVGSVVPLPGIDGKLYRYNPQSKVLDEVGTHPFSAGDGKDVVIFASCYGLSTPVVATLMGKSGLLFGQPIGMHLWRPL